MYPSPAGATESLLSFDTWDEIELENPVLLEMEADVEALLVNRIGHARGFTKPEYYIVPIDECFKLVGLIRSRWQGLSGGTEVWQEIGQFFGDLKAKSPRAEEDCMPDLSITVEKAEVVPFAASPTLAFKLRVANADQDRNHPHGRAAVPDPDRGNAAAIHRHRSGAASRSVR